MFVCHKIGDEEYYIKSQENLEGDKLTSSSHGFSLASIRISKPSRSKQLFLKGTWASYEENNTPSIDIIVFTINSSISSKTV